MDFCICCFSNKTKGAYQKIGIPTIPNSHITSYFPLELIVRHITNCRVNFRQASSPLASHRFFSTYTTPEAVGASIPFSYCAHNTLLILVVFLAD